MSDTLVVTDTHESDVLYSQAMELISRNHMREAMKRFEEALQISPNNAVYMSHYGVCVAIEKEDIPAARKLCERAVKMDPKNPVARVNLGKVQRLQGDNELAHKTFIQAWKTDKTHPAAASELSRMGIRRPPVFSFLSRTHWLNKKFGMLRARFERSMLQNS
jgi:Flp pilus assembly protein TadD